MSQRVMNISNQWMPTFPSFWLLACIAMLLFGGTVGQEMEGEQFCMLEHFFGFSIFDMQYCTLLFGAEYVVEIILNARS